MHKIQFKSKVRTWKESTVCTILCLTETLLEAKPTMGSEIIHLSYGRHNQHLGHLSIHLSKGDG